MRQLIVLLLVFQVTFIAGQTTDSKGRKQGYWKKKDQDNKLLYEGEFKDDAPVGEFKYYYPNDSIRAILNFKNAGTTAYAKLFHRNGKKMAEGKYLNREIKDSVWTYYDELGVRISRDVYKMGKKNGTSYVYLPEGHIVGERTYKEDVEHGEFKEYFNEGSLKSKIHYVNGKLDGRAVYYYPNGVEVAAGYYKDGHKTGPWIYRTESNKVREKELYKQGHLASEKETAEFFAKNKVQEPAVKSTGPAKKQTATKNKKSLEVSHE